MGEAMTVTFVEARNEMLTVFKDAWDTTGFDAYYEGIHEDLTDQTEPWARVVLRHFGGRQASLAEFSGVARWERTGQIFVQVFTPMGEGLTRNLTLCKTVVDAYEGTRTAGGVWFRNIRPTEIGPDGQWFQTNVTIDFEYDEIK